mmetsp:Transcript_5001/g.12951  ORF Transcript_5001/g.12951 Transcript_5001/m.12951 type:complete len:511 (+) Transcript_5001:139-1671(+)
MGNSPSGAPANAAAALSQPAQAGRFDEDELVLLRRAFAKGDAGGLSRAQFGTAFGAMLPTGAIDRLFARMARGEGPLARVPWCAWVDGLAAWKPASGAHLNPGLANAARLGVLWELMASADAQPDPRVLELDKAALESSDELEDRALDEPSLFALLVCCARHCSDAQGIGGASALEPVVADALLVGSLSRAAWVRWACACVPRLGEVAELLVMRGVAVLAAASLPSARSMRVAEERWMPRLVGLSGSEEAESPSLVLTPALTWAISLAVPQPSNGSPIDEWRLLYTSAEQGLSMNRWRAVLVGYGGPSLVVVSMSNGVSWAAYVDTPWTPSEAGRFFGSEDCALFALAPRFHAFPATKYSGNYCSFVQNVKAIGNPAARGQAGVEELVGFGGAASRYRASLTEDLTRAIFRHSCSTYATDTARMDLAGMAREEDEHRVTTLEFFGLGGEAADSALRNSRLQSEKGRARAGRVNRAAFGETWQDSPDKMLMELGGKTFHSDNLRQPEHGAA